MNAFLGSLRGRDMAGIFLAACCLGFAYNASSPLGVRAAATEPAPRTAARAAGAGSYSNETLSIGTQRVAAPIPATGWSNETLTAEIIRLPVAAAAPAPARKFVAPLTWPEVKPLVAAGTVVLVDAREIAAFEAGHIPGAISLPFTQLTQRIAAFAAVYRQNQPLVIYCASNQCPVSQAEAAALIEQYGYTDVREMPGGYAEWRLAEAAANPPPKGTP